MAERITPRAENYSQWYVDTVIRSKLADYAPIKGCMVIRPRGFALWEKMKAGLDNLFKETGHQNAYFPMLIPESFLRKEAEHVEGFSPELAVVTHAGGEQLEEPLVLRPTSETIIWSMYKKWIQSYRDLPLLINQWANVIRWEKRTRLFLRTTEFLWQEGHTAHATEEEAQEETLKMLMVYKKFAEEYMALPVIAGIKSESEKFAGAVQTYAIEGLMQDKRALQAGTSHNLGQNFAKAFDVTFQTKEGTLDHVWATSWGVSTRLVGALIMAHSDDRGLVLPPVLAPVQVMIVPIFKNENKAEVIGYARKLYDRLKTQISVQIDDDDQNSPGWKFAEAELQGIPIRIEVGPKDMEKNQVVLVRRDNYQKIPVAVDQAETRVKQLLEEIQNGLYHRALAFRKENTHQAADYQSFKTLVEEQGGFIECGWCGKADCEAKIKDETKATIRVLPMGRNGPTDGTCILCGEKATELAVFAKAY
jgi:prolyl-tRNA synthetase